MNMRYVSPHNIEKDDEIIVFGRMKDAASIDSEWLYYYQWSPFCRNKDWLDFQSRLKDRSTCYKDLADALQTIERDPIGPFAIKVMKSENSGSAHRIEGIMLQPDNSMIFVGVWFEQYIQHSVLLVRKGS